MNDLTLIKGLVGSLKSDLNLTSHVDAFTYLCLICISDLTPDQIKDAIIWGEDYSGVDAVYINEKGANILVIDYFLDLNPFGNKFSRYKLASMKDTMYGLFTNTIDLNKKSEQFLNAVKKLKEYWKKVEGTYVPHSFYFCTNGSIPSTLQRKMLEKKLNYYGEYDYYYLDKSALIEKFNRRILNLILFTSSGKK